MNSKIRDYIETLFEGTPGTWRILELKEEMISNAEEKYRDLLEEGMQDEAAFTAVVDSIGDVQEVLLEIEREEGPGYQEQTGSNQMDWDQSSVAPTTFEKELGSDSQWILEREKMFHKKSRYIAIAVGLYIFAAAVFVFVATAGSVMLGTNSGIIALVIGILICIVPTVMLIYVSMTMSEAHLEKWSNGNYEYYGNKRKNHSKKYVAILSIILWMIIVILYFLLSFITFSWYITWMLFPIGGCLQAIICIASSMGGNPD